LAQAQLLKFFFLLFGSFSSFFLQEKRRKRTVFRNAQKQMRILQYEENF